MAELFATATEYLANALTFTRGTVADIQSVGVYHTTDTTFVPAEADFKAALLVQPGDPLAEGQNIDILSLIGPGLGAHDTLTTGVYQRWVMIKTTNETIIRKIDVVTVT